MDYELATRLLPRLSWSGFIRSKILVLAGVGFHLHPSPAQQPEYRVTAVRYATIQDFPVAALVRGADSSERLDIAMVFWLIRGADRIVLFDTGFHRPVWFDRFNVTDYLAPDDAVQLAGVDPTDVSDLVISHAHWDHMGGLDLFPGATIWIQRGEFVYYTTDAWQERRRGGGADAEDVVELLERNVAGAVRFIEGDDIEFLPGIRAYTGARHTFSSQYITVAANPPVLLASDNVYLYRNIESYRPVATFLPADTTANLRAISRMVNLVGDMHDIVPGHDPQLFVRYRAEGRLATIR